MTKTNENPATQRFTSIIDQYKDVIAKVCSLYSSQSSPFDDLYQEVLVNLWAGMESYRGEAKISTWVYRVAINTCITWHRRNRRFTENTVPIDATVDPADTSADTAGQYRELYRLIAKLEPVEKAIVALWLDEKSYEEISAVMGLTKANVATRMHRIRVKLSRLANQ